MIAGIDDQSLDPPDCPVRGVNALAAAHLDLARGYTVMGERSGASAHAPLAPPARAHADAHAQSVVGPREHLPLPVAPLSARSWQELRLLSVFERLELRAGAPQPDLLRRRAHEID